MATLAMTSNGVAIDPELPVEREDLFIGEDVRHRSGQNRRALIAIKKRLAYGRRKATEAQRTAWLNAHPWNVSYTHVDELGVSRIVITKSRTDNLTRTQPTVAGTPAYYDLTAEVEEV